MLGMLGWIAVGLLAGAAVSTVLISFWDEIRQWLNNVAADVVERAFGYNARNKMHRAIAKIDRIANKIRNRSTVYTKSNQLDTHFVKVTTESHIPSYEINDEIVTKIRNEGELVQEFKYNA